MSSWNQDYHADGAAAEASPGAPWVSPGGMVAGSLQCVIVGEALESTRMIQEW